MRRNSHVQFLGGPSSIRMGGYPTEGALPALIGVNQACGGVAKGVGGLFTQRSSDIRATFACRPDAGLRQVQTLQLPVSYSAVPGNHKAAVLEFRVRAHGQTRFHITSSRCPIRLLRPHV
jgi:hypothetical protein